MIAADVDGDGDVDAVSASYTDDTIAWYENDGSQNFTFHAIGTNADGARSAVVADLDQDGDVDVLSASVRDNKIAWYENDGSQNFTVHTLDPNTNSGSYATNVIAADLDGDGDLDIIGKAGDAPVVWFENFSGQFVPVASNIETNPLPYRYSELLSIGDCRDGQLDQRLRTGNDGTANCACEFARAVWQF